MINLKLNRIVNFEDLFLVEIYRKIKVNFYLLCLKVCFSCQGHQLFFKTINFKSRFNYIKIRRHAFQPLFKRSAVNC
jgi:hypothetical protein